MILNKGDKYTHIVKAPTSPMFGEWAILTVTNDTTYGYLSTNNVYILHNESGPAFITDLAVKFPNVYALDGYIFDDEKQWNIKIRELKLNRILNIK